MRYAFVSVFLYLMLCSRVVLAQRVEAVYFSPGKNKWLCFGNGCVKAITPDTLIAPGNYIPLLYFNEGYQLMAGDLQLVKLVPAYDREEQLSLGVLMDTFMVTKSVMALPASMRNKTGSENYYLLRYFDFQQRRIESGNWQMSPPTYYLNYGHKYLQRFREETRATLSRKGKIWLDRTLINLQKAVEDVLEKNAVVEQKDETFNDVVYKTHAEAYAEAGFVKLSILDKVKIALTPDASDLLDERGLALVREMRKKQFAYYRSHPLFAARQAIELAAGMGEIVVRVAQYAAKYGVERGKVMRVVWAMVNGE